MNTSRSSTFRACTLPGRVVIIHDMSDQTVISELDLEQADQLLQQLQYAVGSQLLQNQEPAGFLPPASTAPVRSIGI